ncbi:PD-(D/E)XK nuclease family protein [Bacillus sp. 166amftsu]|uniref:PDDEXK-like family protein n=1 Tax=Bacillus sp. 166amftsu TaxID=1761753 RepID=UPI00089A16AE|nr:PD-(D/E)XK nuclease family protein [Bacillus sp. 166amftsu]SDZ07388.1 PD-(D/E)XK nuclease superfamily protein [Bacillus sp. 166amftsu]
MDYNFEILSLLDNSIEFEKLHSKFNRFNPFKILKVDKFEIRHSNMISWLLDPKGNHHLSSFFVSKVLSKTFVKTENEDLISKYNFIKLHKQSLQDLEVFREVQTSKNKRIDILAISESQKIVILIENKYKSSESDGQLQNYLDFVSSKYEGYTIIPIFLSLDGSAPSHKEYFILDYGDILNILKGQLEINSEYTSSTIKDFLSYYIDILEGELVRDEEDIELALTIYKNHKDAVDFLCLSGDGKVAGKFANNNLLDAVKGLSAEEKEDLRKIYMNYAETLTFIREAGNSVMRESFLQFVTQNQIPNDCYHEHIRIPSFIFPEWKQLDDIVGIPTHEWWLNNALITWFERKEDGRMKLIIEVGPLEYKQRLKLLCKLEENGINIKGRSKESGSMYTRIYAGYEKISDWADQDEILRVMNKMYNSSDFNKVIETISETIEGLIYGEETPSSEIVEVERNQMEVDTLADAFQLFVHQQGFQGDFYNIHHRLPSFIMPEFRLLEEQFGVPKWNWWLNNCVIMWFERLKDNRLKFIIEVGPLESHKRIALLTMLESKGIKISARAKKPEAAYTRIYTSTCNVDDWSDEGAVLHAMSELFNDGECQSVIKLLTDIAKEEVHI